MRRLRPPEPGGLPEPVRARALGDARARSRHGRLHPPGAWPAVRKTVIDYHAAAFPGDVLRFEQTLTHRGRTSFTMRQTARRAPGRRAHRHRRVRLRLRGPGRPADPRARRNSARSWSAHRAEPGRHPAGDGERRQPRRRGAGRRAGGAVRPRVSARPDHLGRPGRRARGLSPNRARPPGHGAERRARPGLWHRDLRRRSRGAARRPRRGRGRSLRLLDGRIHRVRVPAAVAQPGARRWCW